MKNYLKGVWEYFASHMLFMYIGAVSFAWIDIWFFKKIEPSTITATATTITLGLAIYALTKVNEWIKTKKSEKAFERTTLFLDTLFKMINTVEGSAISITTIPYEDLSEDRLLVFNELVIEDSKIKAEQAVLYHTELETIMDSFSMWDVTLICEDAIKSLLKIVGDLQVELSTLLILSKLDGSSSFKKEQWDTSTKNTHEYLEKIDIAIEPIQKLKYDEIFKIKK